MHLLNRYEYFWQVVFVYNISIFLYALGIRIASWTGNAKAKQWLAGRKDIFKKISSAVSGNEERIWFHCASLGEFEQGRPVMEKLKMNNGQKIVLTFFSPSGYEIRKNYAGADYIFYLPMDTAVNAQKFIEIIKPSKAIFVKYEYWHHYFHALKNKNIPLYIVSGIFRKDQAFFKWYGGFFRNILTCVRHFFVQDENSKTLLSSIGFTNVTLTGDTRFDRVASIAAEAKVIPIVEAFKDGKKVFIAGSSWPQDEAIILEVIKNNPLNISKYIFAPHEIGSEKIKALYNNLVAIGITPLLYSAAASQDVKDASVLIMDNMGMLSSLYRYGDIAFIGGGFGKGIHNVPEAAVFGMPVFFGPNYQKFKEAKDLIALGGAFSIQSYSDLEPKLRTLAANPEQWLKAAAISADYVRSNKGATDTILASI